MPTPAKPLPKTKFQLAQAARQSRERFLRVRKAEKRYARQLRQVAKQVGHIIKGFAPQGVVNQPATLTATLHRYAGMLLPWAQQVAAAFVAEVSKRDATAWFSAGRELGMSLNEEIARADTGVVMKQKLAEQVDLITSLPLQEAQRVHELTIRNISLGGRSKEVAREIMRSGQVTASRAELIARTETGRTSTAFTQARAEAIGSDGYFWESAEDADVRPEHKKLQGKYILWSNPPKAGPNGERYHAGAGPNCRCFPRPELPKTV